MSKFIQCFINGVAPPGGGTPQWALLDMDGQGFARLRLSSTDKTPAQINLLGLSVSAGTLSADGAHLVLSGLDNSVLHWNRQTGTSRLLEAEISPANAPLHHVAISPDGRLLALIELNGTVTLLRTEDGAPLAHLVSMADGAWAAIGTDGRYDASDPGQMDRLSWIAQDDPLYPLPVEAFIQDYFEPRLLGRLLAGEALPTLRPPQDRNRVTPRARIIDISDPVLQPDGVPAVTVEVQVKQTRRNGQASGLGTVKLFRGGQLVGQIDGAKPDPQGQTRLRFENIALPQGHAVRFSTYAFNDDSIKGQTHTRTVTFDRPDGPQPRRTAYVISVGVNAYASPNWNLNYAASDARATAELISASLRRNGGFDQVIDLALTSTVDPDHPRTASLPMITSVLRQLGGTATRSDLSLPGVPLLPRAKPDDMVYIALAGHGLAHKDGLFHFFTQEFGRDQSTRQMPDDLTGQSLSSDVLGRLMRDIDARDMVLVIDACNAAASVEGSGFKPGPMGSKGLGQLAYDKAMRVLVARQAEAVALESDRLRHGALTYALLREGLEAGAADAEPQDGRINLGELLTFGRDRVPDVYRGLRTGSFKPLSRGAFSLNLDEEVALTDVQQPSLFDFRRDRTGDVMIDTTP